MNEVYKLEDLLKPEYILTNLSGDTKEEIIKKMSDYAEKLGLVNDKFYDDVMERERIYPTGLPTEGLKVALPHPIEKSSILKPAILIAKLAKQVAFKEMGDGVRDVMVDMVFLLAVKGAQEQLGVLQSIVGMFSSQKAIEALKNANTEEEILNAIKDYTIKKVDA